MDAEETQRPSRFGDEHEGGQKKPSLAGFVGYFGASVLCSLAQGLSGKRRNLKFATGLRSGVVLPRGFIRKLQSRLLIW